MMPPEVLFEEMRRRIESDPSGAELGLLIVAQKESGLPKSDAQRLLTLLLEEYQRGSPQSEAIGTKEDGISAVLDRVLGWCSHNHIYPADQKGD